MSQPELLDFFEVNKRILEALGLGNRPFITQVVITIKNDGWPTVVIEEELLTANSVDALAMCFEQIPEEHKHV